MNSKLQQRKAFLFTNFFCHEVFQILVYFLSKNCNPPWKKSPPTPLLKTEVLLSPPFWNFGRTFNLSPLAERGGGGVHTMGQLAFFCFSFSFSTLLHFVAIVVYNFTISCLELKYASSSCETSKLHLLHKMISNFGRMFLSAIKNNNKKQVV